MNTDAPSEKAFMLGMQSILTWIDKQPDQTKPQRQLDEELFSHSRKVRTNAPCILESPTALADFFDYVRAVEGYTKKGRDIISRSWVESLEYIMYNCFPDTYEEDERVKASPTHISAMLKCIEFILERVDTTPARTDRVARVRARLWQILEQFLEQVLVKDVIEAAMRIMASKKHKVDERLAALSLATLFIEEDDSDQWEQIRKVVNAAGRHKSDFAMAAYGEDDDLW